MTIEEVTPGKLQSFLEEIGRCYRHSGRIFLVGGSSLLLVAGKTSTLDIDLDFDVEPAYHSELIQCLRQTSRRLNLPVEQAAPHQFIPLPQGYQERHQYIGRYGALEVFHFDFYAAALSKIHRGNTKDFTDTIQMVHQAIIDFAELKRQFHEVLPQLETFSLRADPEDFRRKFALFEQMLLDSRPSQRE